MKTEMGFCPLMKKEVSYEICFDIHMVVCDEAPIETAPKKAVIIEHFKDICNACEHHRND